jgi:uncharacterized cupin superfamily protein
MKFPMILLASFIMFSSTAIAQSISGKVVDPSGNPKQGVAVVIENKRGQSVDATFTSATGTFDLRGIPWGDYILRILSGRTTLWQENVTLSERSPAKDVGTVSVK